jgi:hypothetical protein
MVWLYFNLTFEALAVDNGSFCQRPLEHPGSVK